MVLGLELTAGLVGFGTAITLTGLAVLWNYSSLPEVRWSEITAGVMAFVAGAGLEVLAGGDALGVWTAVVALDQLVAALYVAGGLLVLVGGLVNSFQLLQRQYG